MQREISSPVKSNLRTSIGSNEFLQNGNQTQRNHWELRATTSQSVRADYTPGDFVAVGLKPRKGPINVYIAEVTHVYEAECGLKYMKKSENAYVWLEMSNMSQELTENIISKL